MMIQTHNTQQELALHAMHGLPLEKADSIRKHLELCSDCRNDLEDVCWELALMGVVVRQRELPLGARQRFMEKVADAASVKAKEALAKVASISAAGERRNISADLVGDAGIFHIAPMAERNLDARGTSPIQKKALLHMIAPVSTPSKKAIPGSKVETGVVAASKAMAARIVSIF
jgi:hypothetical protein